MFLTDSYAPLADLDRYFSHITAKNAFLRARVIINRNVHLIFSSPSFKEQCCFFQVFCMYFKPRSTFHNCSRRHFEIVLLCFRENWLATFPFESSSIK